MSGYENSILEGRTKQRGDGVPENGGNMGAACSNRWETCEFHSHY